MVIVKEGMSKQEARTKRGLGRDHYPTPLDFCRYAIRKLSLPPRPTVLDAGAGAGPWLVALREVYPNAHLVGVDLPGVAPLSFVHEWFSISFETWAPWYAQVVGRRFDAVIGNPPFQNDTPERWLASIFDHLLTPSGQVLWLLRLAWLASQGRRERLFKAGRAPLQVWVQSRRVSFTGDGKVDADDYGLYLFSKALPAVQTFVEFDDWQSRAASATLFDLARLAQGA